MVLPCVNCCAKIPLRPTSRSLWSLVSADSSPGVLESSRGRQTLSQNQSIRLTSFPKSETCSSDNLLRNRSQQPRLQLNLRSTALGLFIVLFSIKEKENRRSCFPPDGISPQSLP